MADITVSSDIDTFLRSADKAAARASIGGGITADITVSTNADKLDLTGLAVGTVVCIENEGNRLEVYKPSVTPVPALSIKGLHIPNGWMWSDADFNDEQNWSQVEDVEGRPSLLYYDGTEEASVAWVGTYWEIYSTSWGEVLYESTEDVANPWDVVTWTPAGYGNNQAPDQPNPISYVAPQQEGVDVNWHCITHTAEILYDTGYPYGDETFAGISLSTYGSSDESLGWYDISAGLPFDLGPTPSYRNILRIDGVTASYNNTVHYDIPNKMLYTDLAGLTRHSVTFRVAS